MTTKRIAGRIKSTMLLALLLTLLGGCRGAIVGRWGMVEAVPNREVFSIDDATFHNDGSFTATSTIEGLTTREEGQFSFNGFKLTLRPQAGGQRVYYTHLKGKRLEITNGDRKVVLHKER